MVLRGLYDLYKLLKKTFFGYGFQVAVIILLGFANSIFEGMGISTIVPVFSVITHQNNWGEVDFITKNIQGFLGWLGFAATLKTLLVFMGVLFVSKIFVLFLIQYFTAKIVFGYESDTRTLLLSKTFGANWEYLSGLRVGYLDQLLLTNISQVSQFFYIFSVLSLVLSKFIIYVFIVLNFSAGLVFFIAVLGFAALFVFKPLFYKNRVVSGKVESLNKTIAHFVNQTVSGMKTVKAMHMSDAVSKIGEDYFKKMKDYSVNIVIVRKTAETLMQGLAIFFMLALFVYYYKSPAFNLAKFGLMIFAINQIFSYIQSAQEQLHAVKILEPYLKSVQDSFLEIDHNKEKSKGTLAFVFHHAISFKGVDFSYRGGKKIFSDFNLTFNKGEISGIIGPSGAGKTTLVDLLLRLRDPQVGNIFVDNVDISQILIKDLRDNIGYVPQDAFLINDTIRNNISFYNPSLSENDILTAAQMANVEEFVKLLPNGYDTVIGEKGMSLSGGQRQRIMIARVLARKPKILILDEATNALDSESELRIWGALAALRNEMTVIVIAHRLTMLTSADRVISLGDGGVIEDGSPQHLLADQNSYFSRMYNLSHQKNTS